MATEFTLFPQLITELRLAIWGFALPEPLSKPLYPYKKGCWTFEDMGLEPDPNGEDLYMKFDTDLLDPLPIKMPLYSVSQEARDVAKKYIAKQNLVTLPSCPEYVFGRPFDSRTDTVFLSKENVEVLVTELVNRQHEPDLLNRYVSTANPAIQRLAITTAGLLALGGEALGVMFDTAGSIGTLYVIDHDEGCDFTSREMEEEPRAIIRWSSERSEWECSEYNEGARRLKELIEGIHHPDFTTDGYDLDVHLMTLTVPRMV